MKVHTVVITLLDVGKELTGVEIAQRVEDIIVRTTAALPPKTDVVINFSGIEIIDMKTLAVLLRLSCKLSHLTFRLKFDNQHVYKEVLFSGLCDQREVELVESA